MAKCLGIHVGHVQVGERTQETPLIVVTIAQGRMIMKIIAIKNMTGAGMMP